MPKISTLGQKLWPTGREQTHTHTDRQTEKANTEDPFFRFLPGPKTLFLSDRSF